MGNIKNYDKLFESIIVIGKAESSIFDEIAAQEEKMAENQDLYDAFDKVYKVLEAPSRYAEIQGVDPKMDVNNGCIQITGTCKHDVKADAQDLNRVEDQHTDEAFTHDIVEEYAKDLQKAIPKNLKVDLKIVDDTMMRMGKTQFIILITRKG
jgi:hypothetical protein